MIIIQRNVKTKKFRVRYTGKNNEILSISEPLNSKQSAWKNIHAMYCNFPKFIDSPYVEVKDETLPKPEVFVYNLDTKAKSKKCL